MSHKPASSIQIALVLSIVVHLLLNGATLLLPKLLTQSEVENKNVVELSVIEQDQQIVDQSQTAINDEVPENSKYLSAHNQTVKKQTVAKERGQFHNGQGARGQKQATASRKTLADFQPSYNLTKEPTPRSEPPAPKQETAGGTGPSQSLDYIKELDPGLETLLSTREFMYYSFYQRVRNQLNQYWAPKVREKLTQVYKQGRNIASSDDKITKCLVTLDRNGALVKIQIIGISGLTELDEAAVEAFRAAAPFPNPPSGMSDENGLIQLRWDFILEA